MTHVDPIPKLFNIALDLEKPIYWEGSAEPTFSLTFNGQSFCSVEGCSDLALHGSLILRLEGVYNLVLCGNHAKIFNFLEMDELNHYFLQLATFKKFRDNYPKLKPETFPPNFFEQ